MLSGLMPQPPYPWFQAAWQNFSKQVSHDRVPHALLLIGQRGIGCLELAKAMAQILLCNAPLEGQSCGTCKSCLLCAAESHPDFHLLMPEEKSTSIKIDQIRSLSAVTSNTAQQGGRKLIVISPAEAMNANAANALLKNLEEPSGNCVYILIAEKAAVLMATIRSRCSRTVLPIPATEVAVAWLERNRINDAAALLRETGGRPLQVVEWLEQDIWGQKETLRQEFERLLTSDYSFLECAKSILGFGALWVIEQLLIWLSQAVPAALSGQNSVKESGQGVLVDALTGLPARKLIRFYDVLLTKKRLLLSGANPNPQMLLEEITMEMKELSRKTN